MSQQMVLITEPDSQRLQELFGRLRETGEAHVKDLKRLERRLDEATIEATYESVRTAWNRSTLPPPGAFLDFDPVLPGWPEPKS